MKKIFALVIATTALATTSPAQNSTWTQKADFGGAARDASVGFSIGTKGYIGTGESNDGSYHYYKDFWEYDPATDAWTQMADFGGGARSYAVGFSIGSKGYLGTGGGTSLRRDFWEYDPETNTWTQKADFRGAARQGAVGFSIGSNGYLGTGETASGSTTDFWEYDPTTDTWAQKANCGGPTRIRGIGFSIINKGYIGNGWSYAFGTFYSDFWEYEPSTNAWSQKADFGGGGRLDAAGFSINGRGYIGTGIDPNYAYKKDFWEYDPSSDTWSQKADCGGTGRQLPVGFSIGNKGYIGTGQTCIDCQYKDFWEYNACDSGLTVYADADGDGYGNLSSSIINPTCDIAAGYATNNTDCNDANASIHPNQSEITGDGIDNNCNGVVDENNALNFDGVNDYINVNTALGNFGTGDFTVELQAKTSNQASYQRVLSKRGICGHSNFFNLNFSNGKFSAELDESGSGTNYISLVGTTTVTDGQWHHLALTRTSGLVGLYVDGELEANGTSVANLNNSYSFEIGGSPECTVYFLGEIDEVRVWNVARTQSEIQTDMLGTTCGGQTGLVAYYTFNQGIASGANTSETSLDDLTSNNNNGTLTNFALTGSTSNWVTGVPGLSDSAIFYLDADGDGFGNANASIKALACSPPAGYIWDNTDCNDANAAIHPGAVELDNCIDDNCNGVIDDGMWLQKANFKGVARHDAVGFVINGKVYLGTGDDNNGQYQKDLWEYDPATNVWKQKADFKGDGRFKAASFSIGTKGYIGTGVNNNGTLLNDFWEYDVAANSWTQKADFGGSPRQRAVGFSIGTYGYIGTGADFLTQKNDFWQYDPFSNSWTQKANVGDSLRGGAAGFSIGTKGYIGTGYSKSGGYKNDFWEYDPLSDSWTRKADFPGSARSGAVGFSIDSNGYIATGFDGTTYYTNGYEYIPAIDTWKQIVDLVGNARAYAVAGSVSGKAYISTGSITGSAFKDVWEYAPPATVQIFAYGDADGDGYGNAATSVPVSYCNIPGGYVLDSTDCNDQNANVHPGATEICNGIDDNCDGLIDPTTNYYADVDGDGYGNVHSRIDSCARPLGYVTDSSDCNDQNPNVHPGATEICNNIDDNCNGQVDEGVQSTFYADTDGDGYGTPKSSVIACSQPAGYVIDSTDCDDTNPNVNPGEKEIPNNGIDDNCNGLIDEFGTGVSSITNSASTLSVFPNPTNGTFIIELKLSNQVSEQATVEVINVLGQTVLSQKAEINKGKLQQEINLANVMSGVYLVKVIVNNKVYTKQISLEK